MHIYNNKNIVSPPVTIINNSDVGDGNCLLHAVTMAVWGLSDKAMLLRRLLYINLVEDKEEGKYRQRWKLERERLDASIPDEEYSMGSEVSIHDLSFNCLVLQ